MTSRKRIIWNVLVRHAARVSLLMSWAFVFAWVPAKSQVQNPILYVGPGGMTIGKGTLFSADSLLLTPSTDYTLSNTSITREYSLVSSGAQSPWVSRGYLFSPTAPTFTGSIGMIYQNSELNGLTESKLQLYVNNGAGWKFLDPSTRDTVSNTIITQSVTALALKELGLDLACNAATVAGTLALNAGSTTCTTGNSGSLTLSNYYGSITKWEYSTDGGKTWTVIATKGISYTNPTYTYANLTKSSSYRVTVSGCVLAVSNIVAVNLTKCGVTLSPTGTTLTNSAAPSDWLTATAMPNPSTYTFTLKVEASRTDKTQIAVYDMTGLPVETAVCDPGYTVSFGQKLAKGVYTVVVTQGQLRKVIKVMKI